MNGNNDDKRTIFSKVLSGLKIPNTFCLAYLITLLATGKSADPLGRNKIYLTCGVVLLLFALGKVLRKAAAYVRARKVVKDFVEHYKFAFDEFFTDFVERHVYPEVTATDFIQWATKGRFDVNVQCHENQAHRMRLYNGRICPRNLCHFGPVEYLERFPRLLADRLPRRARKSRRIYLGPNRTLRRKGKWPRPGRLIGWTAKDITCEFDRSEWDQIKKDYKGKPLILFTYVCLQNWFANLLFPIYTKVFVHLRRTKQQHSASGIRVYGEFRKGFQPDEIVRAKKSWLSIPVCQAWEAQGVRPPICDYHKNAPVRLHALKSA